MRLGALLGVLHLACARSDEPPLAAGSPNEALRTALQSDLRHPQPDGSPPAGIRSLLSLPRSLAVLQPAADVAPRRGEPPACPGSAAALNAVADLMQVLHDPATERAIEGLARDERALRWVVERTRESMADPERFFEMLAQPAAANMLSALRDRPQMLHTGCAAPSAAAGRPGVQARGRAGLGLSTNRTNSSSLGATVANASRTNRTPRPDALRS